MSRVAPGVVMLMALCQTSIAAAAEGGFYIGASGGRSEYKVDADDLALPVSPVSAPTSVLVSAVPGVILSPGVTFNPVRTPIFSGEFTGTPVAAFVPFSPESFDRKDSTWSLTAGYRFNPYLSVELSYIDLGEIESRSVANLALPGSFVSIVMEQSVAITAISAAVLGSWPVAERWSLHVRGGYEFADSESSLRFNSNTLGRTTDDSENLVVGAGIDFAWTPHWSLRVTAERHLDIGGEVFRNDSDADVYRLSVLYRL